MIHEPHGSRGEDCPQADLCGSFDGSLYKGNREIYNIYYVRDADGTRLRQQFCHVV